MNRLLRLLAVVPLLPLAAACSDASSATGRPGPATTLQLGYFANVTHATPLVGVGKGFYAKHLGATALETQVFNAGPAAVEALLAGSIDAAYVGPSPAINAYVRSRGEAIRIVAGATSGGASLVVRNGITSAAQLKGRTLATPSLGNTQDVALRAWLKANGLAVDRTGRGDVTIAPGENATTLQLFQDGRIDGAWVPEPWASRLVLDGGGTVLVDERTLWPGGRFVTTHLVVATRYLRAHPETVRALLAGQLETNAWIAANPAAARTATNGELFRLTTKRLSDAVVERAFEQIAVTDDPLAASLATQAAHAVEAGLLTAPKLDGIYDLSLLDELLRAAGRPPVAAAGLGRE